MMRDHEPDSGYNLPAGCLDVPAGEPDDRACMWCRHCIEECCDMGICELRLRKMPGDFADWQEAMGCMEGARVDMQEDTCARWEEYR